MTRKVKQGPGTFLLKTGLLHGSYSYLLHRHYPTYGMYKTGLEKTTEEIFQERADVLYRTGEALSEALQKLTSIEKSVDRIIEALNTRTENEKSGTLGTLHAMVNREISRYNKAREHAKLRYHYLIITREAMGIRRHTWVDEVYRVPPRKQPVGKTCE